MSALRPLLYPVTIGSLILGATGVLSPVLSTLLWLPAVLVLTLQSSSPVMRLMTSALLRNGQPR